MKKLIRTEQGLSLFFFGAGILAVFLAAGPQAAFASIIHGEVVEVKDDGNSFVFKRFNPSNPELSEQFDIAVQADTKMENVSSLNELAIGDEIVAEAEKRKESRIWDASALKVLKVKLYEDIFAPLKPVQESPRTSQGGEATL